MVRIKHIKPQSEVLTEAKARLIAHLIGDGCVYKCRTDYNIKYDIIDLEVLYQFQDDFRKVYGLESSITWKPSGKTEKLCPYVRIRAKKAYEDLLRYTQYGSFVWSVPKEITSASMNIQKEFLKALFDDEGSVIPIGKKAVVRLYSTNEKGLLQIQEMMQKFGFESNIKAGYGCKRNVFGLVIKDIQFYYEKIGFYCLRKQKKLEKYVKVGSENPHSTFEVPPPGFEPGTFR